MDTNDANLIINSHKSCIDNSNRKGSMHKSRMLPLILTVIDGVYLITLKVFVPVRTM